MSVKKKLGKDIKRMLKIGMVPYEIANILEKQKEYSQFTWFEIREKADSMKAFIKPDKSSENNYNKNTKDVDILTNSDNMGMVVSKPEQLTFNIKHPIVKIGYPLYSRIMKYVNSVDIEISGVGITSRKDDVISIDDVFLLEQISSSGSTELNDESLSKLLVELVQKNVDTSKLNFWWHSHGNGSTFWSTTDDKACEDLNNKNYTVAIVFSQSHSPKCRIDIYSPFRITLDSVKISVEMTMDKVQSEAIEEEVKKKVKKESFGSENTDYRGIYGDYGYGYGQDSCYFSCGNCPQEKFDKCKYHYKDTVKKNNLSGANRLEDKSKDSECDKNCSKCPNEVWTKCTRYYIDNDNEDDVYGKEEIKQLIESGFLKEDKGIIVDTRSSTIIQCDKQGTSEVVCAACQYIDICDISFARDY